MLNNAYLQDAVSFSRISLTKNFPSYETSAFSVYLCVTWIGSPPSMGTFQIAGLPENVVEKLDLVFYADVDRAVMKTLEF